MAKYHVQSSPVIQQFISAAQAFHIIWIGLMKMLENECKYTATWFLRFKSVTYHWKRSNGLAHSVSKMWTPHYSQTNIPVFNASRNNTLTTSSHRYYQFITLKSWYISLPCFVCYSKYHHINNACLLFNRLTLTLHVMHI